LHTFEQTLPPGRADAGAVRGKVGFGRREEEVMEDLPGTARSPLIAVSREDCIAAGECARIAPQVFDQDEADGTVLLRQGFAISDPLLKQIRHAVAACPARALDLVEDD